MTPQAFPKESGLHACLDQERQARHACFSVYMNFK